jgi:phage-related protein
MREVIFYRKENGACPVELFLDSLSAKQAKKVAWVLRVVRQLPIVPSQYLKKLVGTNGIWEIRIDSGSDTFRLLGFFDRGKLIVLTNGFAKKSQQTPVSEIEIAENRRRNYLERRND